MLPDDPPSEASPGLPLTPPPPHTHQAAPHTLPGEPLQTCGKLPFSALLRWETGSACICATGRAYRSNRILPGAGALSALLPRGAAGAPPRAWHTGDA